MDVEVTLEFTVRIAGLLLAFLAAVLLLAFIAAVAFCCADFFSSEITAFLLAALFFLELPSSFAVGFDAEVTLEFTVRISTLLLAFLTTAAFLVATGLLIFSGAYFYQH